MVTPLGSDKSHRVSVRLIAATHRDIKRLIAEGRFREDLYYRLAGYEIAVPALRDRQSDIPLLVDHFRPRDVPGASRAVLDLFAAHPWPGNVRELEQVVRRTIIDSGTLTDVDAAARTLRAVSVAAGFPPAEQKAEKADLVP